MGKNIWFIGCILLLSCAHDPGPPSGSRRPNGTNGGLAEDSDSAPFLPLTNEALWITGSLPQKQNLNQIVGIYSNADAPTVDKFISFATRSIDIEIYEMDDPAVRDQLRAALSKNVKVRVVIEPKPIGQVCDPLGAAPKISDAGLLGDCLDQQKLVAQIRAAEQNKFVTFNKTELCGQDAKKGPCYQHGKAIVIDGEMALISTGNFNRSNLCDLAHSLPPGTCNRDFSYITRDPDVVAVLQNIFEKDLLGKRYDLKSLLPKAEGKLTVSPYSLDPLVQFIRTAKKSIQIQNQYIRPDSGLPEVLIEKAKEPGMKIEIQVSDECYFGKVSDKRAYDDNLMFGSMEQAGITIKMFPQSHQIDGKKGYLHAKVIVVDEEKAWVGSVNGSSASLTQNREFGIFFSNPERASALSQFLTADFNYSPALSWRESLQCRHVSHGPSTDLTVNDQ